MKGPSGSLSSFSTSFPSTYINSVVVKDEVKVMKEETPTGSLTSLILSQSFMSSSLI